MVAVGGDFRGGEDFLEEGASLPKVTRLFQIFSSLEKVFSIECILLLIMSKDNQVYLDLTKEEFLSNPRN